MRHRLLGAGLLVALVALVSGGLKAQNPKKAPPQDTQPPLDSATLAPGEFTGKLKALPGADRQLTLTITFNDLVPTGKGPGKSPTQQQIQGLNRQLNQAQAQLAKAKRAAQIAQAQAKIANIQAQLQTALATDAAWRRGDLTGGVPPGYKLVSKIRDVEFQTIPDDTVKVRTMFLPEQFDDKGEIKKYTAEEKRKLKGEGADAKLPGYLSSLEKLEIGQGLKVTLVKRRRPAKKTTSEKTEAPAKEKEDPAPKEKTEPALKEKGPPEDDGEKKMQVRLIVIVQEAPSTPSPGDRPKRKKKDNN
jgi:hypothetical protein